MPRLESNLIINRCPHCNVDNPNLTQTCRFETNSFNGLDHRVWVTYACQRCGGVTTAWTYVGYVEIEQMYPNAISLDSSIPDRAKAYLDQAIDSLHAPAGSIMLSASSVDAMLKDKGYREGSLNSRINKAVNDHLITKEMAEWAHEVRLDANDQRHADELANLPTEKDAQISIDFTLALAQFLYVLPSRVQQGIEKSKIE
jgi:Domain of unknown function (DUF4145)